MEASGDSPGEKKQSNQEMMRAVEKMRSHSTGDTVKKASPKKSDRIGQSKINKPRRTKFFWRLIAGLLGAGTALSIQAAFFRADLIDLLNGMATAGDVSLFVSRFPFLTYLPAAGVLLGAALVCGIITALMDRSGFRSLFLGAGWGAMIVIGLLIFRTLQPEEIKKLPLPVRTAEAAINLIVVDQARLLDATRTEAEETREKLEEQLTEAKAALEKAQEELPAKLEEAEEKGFDAATEKAQEELPSKIEAAEKRGAKAKEKEPSRVIESKEKKIASLQEEVEEIRNQLRKLEATIEEFKKAQESDKKPPSEPLPDAAP